ncbi:uncharacterized protein LOC110982224 [Acanthaster planci]|uniref:Uncharacterized protein LOC110982224 n=1 Tax=Acanthaster planci TaxID=133434 RepID=A0A8B7YUN4_ACAPL|nr:uncharacterized protein LOC110982224 [Acanthaster planci]
MSFLKRIGSRNKSTVDLPEDTVKAQKREEKKQKRSSVQGLSGFKSRSEAPPSEDAEGAATTDSAVGTSESANRYQASKDRERKKHKDMSGITIPPSGPSNEYPTFLVHYLGRMPTHMEYGRDAVEKPVEQLCKLREKQKLSRLMLNFNPDGLRCWEVSGPFLKTKKDGFTMSVPLHHITYGVGSNDHPNIFACIIRMNAEPAPGEDQMLILHAFVCAKPEVTQKLTYWQLQAYIEAYEDLKRKRILRDRRRKAMAGAHGETSTPVPTITPVPEEPAKNSGKEITEVKIKGRGKVKVKAHVESGGIHEGQNPNGPSKAVGLVLQDGSQAPVSPFPSNNNTVEESDPAEVFVEASGAATGTMVHRARIVSRPMRMDSSTSDGDNSPPVLAPDRSREGSVSSWDGEGKADTSLQKRIGDLEEFMEMDADMLKKLMVTEHPTLARRICYRATVDTQGVFHQEKVELGGEGQGAEPEASDA